MNSFVTCFVKWPKSLHSRRINIGMDEAHMLGLGKHLERYGYQDRMQIMLRHYRRVIDIAHEFGYEPMMWSDMFFAWQHMVSIIPMENL